MATKNPESLSNISAVERDVGLSKDTLRVWERRYGFPKPLRDNNGERVYPQSQVEKLLLINRLIGQGHRPGKIVGLDKIELFALVAEPGPAEPARQDLEVLLQLLKADSLVNLRQELSQALARQGLQRFVIETIAPLTTAVGDEWVRGNLAIYEEHLYSEVVQGVLRNAIDTIRPQNRSPRVLLTSLPGEVHSLGLLMVEAITCIEGAQSIPLGTETPVPDIVEAARIHSADIVGLSFSAAYPESRAIDGLKQLRSLLPDTVSLVAGGSTVSRIRRPIEGVRLVSDLDQMGEYVKQWRVEFAIT